MTKPRRWRLLTSSAGIVGALVLFDSMFRARIQHWILSLPKPLQMVPFIAVVLTAFAVGMVWLYWKSGLIWKPRNRQHD